jgi:hypothetical protein
MLEKLLLLAEPVFSVSADKSPPPSPTSFAHSLLRG